MVLEKLSRKPDIWVAVMPYAKLPDKIQAALPDCDPWMTWRRYAFERAHTTFLEPHRLQSHPTVCNAKQIYTPDHGFGITSSMWFQKMNLQICLLHPIQQPIQPQERQLMQENKPVN